MEEQISKNSMRMAKMDIQIQKAKSHTKYEMRKIPSAKRTKKWKEIYCDALGQYHAWIDDELLKVE